MRKAVLILLAAVLTLSCTAVKMDEPAPATVNVTCTASWDGAASVPAFDFAASRTMKAVHYYQEGLNTSQGGEDVIQMEPGEYEAVFFASSPQDAYILENKTTFLEEQDATLRVITARLPHLTLAEFSEEFPGFEPLLVSHCDTIAPSPDIWYATVREQVSSSKETQRISFKPALLNKQLSFTITINWESEISKPNRVVANITGTPFRVQVMSAYLETERTGQTTFEFTNTSGSRWEGKVSVLGIKPPVEEDDKVGPGVLRIIVDYGPDHQKLMKVLNLKPYLDATPVLKYADLSGYYVGILSSANFVIDVPLDITDPDTLHGDDDPIGGWRDPEDGDTRDILDGYDDDEYA